VLPSPFGEVDFSGRGTVLAFSVPGIEGLHDRTPSPRRFVQMVCFRHAAQALVTLGRHSNLQEL
jgi:hypothetical protein